MVHGLIFEDFFRFFFFFLFFSVFPVLSFWNFQEGEKTLKANFPENFGKIRPKLGPPVFSVFRFFDSLSVYNLDPTLTFIPYDLRDIPLL